MPMSTYKLRAYSFRTYPTPLDDQSIRTYNCVIPITEIPADFLRWMDVNARRPSATGHVQKAIRWTLDNEPDQFIIYNRGLAIFADSVNYDNREKVVILTFTHKDRHGIFDGGNTLNVVLKKLDDDGLSEGTAAAYCRVEISTGVLPDAIAQIVEARNTSRQVDTKSLFNLEKRFEQLKDALGDDVSNKIAWKENDPAPIDVREVIALLTAMDRVHYDDSKHPLVAYSGKEQCLKHFELSPQCYKKSYPLAKDFLRLWDDIQSYVPQQYKEKNLRFGGLKACKKLKKSRVLPITGATTEYPFPTGYLYPIFAAFRSMLEDRDGVYTWGKGIDPFKLVHEGFANKVFMGAVVNSIHAERNPNRTGKDPNVWSLAYQIAENHYLRMNA